MNSDYEKSIRETYRGMHTDQLIERKLQGDLTEVAAKILEEELAVRSVNELEIMNYKNAEENIGVDGQRHAELASVGRRYVAQFLDQLFGLVFLIGVTFVVSLTGMASLGFMLGLLAYCGYVMLSDGMPNGQSYGKYFLGIKVIDKRTGEDCGYAQSFGRNITTIIPVFAALDAVMILGAKRERLGDKMAHTSVIKI